MEMRQLQMYVALCEELNFTRTAERMHTVQSNVTAQIRQLEEELGARLFDRLPRRVALTDAGARFLPHAQRVLAAADEGSRAVRFGDTPSGRLRIGAPESVLTYRLPAALRRFRERYANVELVLRPYVDWPLTQPLQDGDFDIALRLADRLDEKALQSHIVGTEKIVLAASPDHPLTQRKALRAIDLRGESLLLTEVGCAYRKKLDRVLAAAGAKPDSITEFASVEAIKQCAVLGMGIALLPEIVVAGELAKRRLRALSWSGPRLDIGLHIVWHRDRWRTPAMDGFLSTVTESLTRT